jgi:hypothetical protein
MKKACEPLQSTAENIFAKGEELGLKIVVMCLTCGAASFSSLTYFAPIVGSSTEKPVILPPGLARLCTKPWATGSAMAPL